LDGKNTLIHKTLLTNLITTKSKQKVFTRANISLLNPNIKHDRWSDAEERRLPILMKIYHEHNQSSQPTHDLFLTSTHYARSNKSVVDKWQRSLNPEYLARPFTPAEDAALLAAVRGNETIGWRELSQQHFPNRHPQRLMNRWSEIGSDQDILSRERALLSSKKAG